MLEWGKGRTIRGHGQGQPHGLSGATPALCRCPGWGPELHLPQPRDGGPPGKGLGDCGPGSPRQLRRCFHSVPRSSQESRVSGMAIAAGGAVVNEKGRIKGEAVTSKHI